MVDITGAVAGFMPKIGGSTIFTFITWVLIALIFIGLIGVVTYLIIRWMKFNKKIIIFERIDGQFKPTRRDKAMEMKFSVIGDTIFYLRRHKKYLPTPIFQTGKRIYWYWIRDDGEWINFRPGDFDKDARRLGAKFLDKEMRFARTQVYKGLKERYDKPGFWKQYGLMIFSIGFIVVMGMMTWLLFDKWIEGLAAVPEILDKLEILLDRADSILGKLDNIYSGGRGFQPAS